MNGEKQEKKIVLNRYLQSSLRPLTCLTSKTQVLYTMRRDYMHKNNRT